MQAPSIFKLRDLIDYSDTVRKEYNGMWVPARPLGDTSIPSRFKAAWLVFIGKADAVTWPENQ